MGDMTVAAIVSVAEATVGRREIPDAAVLLADGVGEFRQSINTGDPSRVAFDDHIEPVVPCVDTRRDGHRCGPAEVLRLLLFGAGAEYERAVYPRPDEWGDVRASVLTHGGQPVELRRCERVADLLPADGFRGFAEAGVEPSFDRHTH